jgi:membrane-associated phospholipid phosphatase
VGLARAALGVHYISDLAAGWLVGTAAGAWGAGIAIGL